MRDLAAGSWSAVKPDYRPTARISEFSKAHASPVREPDASLQSRPNQLGHRRRAQTDVTPSIAWILGTHRDVKLSAEGDLLGRIPDWGTKFNSEDEIVGD